MKNQKIVQNKVRSKSHLTNQSSIVVMKEPSFYMDKRFVIDKVDFNITFNLKAKEIIEHLKENGIVYKSYVSSGGQRAILCNKILLYRHPFVSENVYKIVTNPSDFTSYEDYIANLRKTVPVKIYKQMTISRLDIACDIFDKNFQWMNERFKVERKQSLERILDDTRESTRTFGKNNEKIKLYDKMEKLKSARTKSGEVDPEGIVDKYEHCVRAEVSLKTKRKLPTQHIDLLEEKMLSEDFSPFRNVHIVDYEIARSRVRNTRKSIRSFRKRIILTTLVKYNGLQYAYKKLNKNDNFKRNYKDIFKLKSSVCLGDSYHDGIKKYFAGGHSDVQ